jgi:hypothetical protein
MPRKCFPRFHRLARFDLFEPGLIFQAALAASIRRMVSRQMAAFCCAFARTRFEAGATTACSTVFNTSRSKSIQGHEGGKPPSKILERTFAGFVDLAGSGKAASPQGIRLSEADHVGELQPADTIRPNATPYDMTPHWPTPAHGLSYGGGIKPTTVCLAESIGSAHAMTDEEKSILDFDLNNHIYYLTYPSPVRSGLWKDGNGMYLNMASMSIEHLNACIKRIDKDVDHLRSRPDAVSNTLMPMAQKKRMELKDALNRKIAALRSA